MPAGWLRIAWREGRRVRSSVRWAPQENFDCRADDFRWRAPQKVAGETHSAIRCHGRAGAGLDAVCRTNDDNTIFIYFIALAMIITAGRAIAARTGHDFDAIGHSTP